MNKNSNQDQSTQGGNGLLPPVKVIGFIDLELIKQPIKEIDKTIKGIISFQEEYKEQ
ncbi:MAG: hypothetical protein PF542_05605 [Nanoarchaeota archaeon]|jgi:hypothetical protein|nr:hypothetical protein [Nanoarchaeota archaeon]